MNHSPILLRPHHGLCIQNFRGKGYSAAFVAKMSKIVSRLEQNPKQEIILYISADVICKACPHRTADNGCDSGQKVRRYDERCLSLCGLSEGETLSWERYRQLLQRTVILPKRYRQVCAGCQWIGICEENHC